MRTGELAVTTEERRVVERGLRTIEKENDMNLQFTEKALSEWRVSQKRAHAPSQPEAGSVVAPLMEELLDAAFKAGLDTNTPAVTTYDGAPDGDIAITVGFPIAEGDSPLPGYDNEMLPAEPRAICTLHVGDMESISSSWQALHQHIEAQGLTPAGPCREVYLETPEGRPEDWRTELQQPVR